MRTVVLFALAIGCGRTTEPGPPEESPSGDGLTAAGAPEVTADLDGRRSQATPPLAVRCPETTGTTWTLRDLGRPMPLAGAALTTSGEAILVSNHSATVAWLGTEWVDTWWSGHGWRTILGPIARKEDGGFLAPTYAIDTTT